MQAEAERQASEVEAADVVDRMGWIAPMTVRDDGASRSGGDARKRTRLTTHRSAEVVHNRHGERPSVPLELDEANGSLERAPSE